MFYRWKALAKVKRLNEYIPSSLRTLRETLSVKASRKGRKDFHKGRKVFLS